MAEVTIIFLCLLEIKQFCVFKGEERDLKGTTEWALGPWDLGLNLALPLFSSLVSNKLTSSCLGLPLTLTGDNISI